ncbi:hypothetical protein ABFG93_20975 [Pseudalkalibacillus hwajinpoensis]|uniref:hypothetical protein n=1 Tax=Guptibacillus hwajinpoensis TaxID=208199 RepID=UPI00325B5762
MIIWTFFFILIGLITLIKINRGKFILKIIKMSLSLFKYLAFIIILVYLGALLFLLNKTGLVTGLDLLKDYIKLLIFTIIPMIVLVLTKYDEVELSKMIKEIIKFSIVPMYIIGEYTFHLGWELLIVFLATILTLFVALGEYNQEFFILKVFSNFFITILGLLIIFFSFRNFFQSINDVYQLIFWKKMFLGLLVFFHLPLLFLLQISVYYQKIITQLKLKNTLVGNFRGKLKVMIIIFKTCNWNKNKLEIAFKEVRRHRVETFNKLNELLSA